MPIRLPPSIAVAARCRRLRRASRPIIARRRRRRRGGRGLQQRAVPTGVSVTIPAVYTQGVVAAGRQGASLLPLATDSLQEQMRQQAEGRSIGSFRRVNYFRDYNYNYNYSYNYNYGTTTRSSYRNARCLCCRQVN